MYLNSLGPARLNYCSYLGIQITWDLKPFSLEANSSYYLQDSRHLRILELYKIPDSNRLLPKGKNKCFRNLYNFRNKMESSTLLTTYVSLLFILKNRKPLVQKKTKKLSFSRPKPLLPQNLQRLSPLLLQLYFPLPWFLVQTRIIFKPSIPPGLVVIHNLPSSNRSCPLSLLFHTPTGHGQ